MTIGLPLTGAPSYGRELPELQVPLVCATAAFAQTKDSVTPRDRRRQIAWMFSSRREAPRVTGLRARIWWSSPRRRAYSPTFPPALRSLRPRWRRQAPVHSGPESVFW